jgi:RNA polymerase sigma factor (sigma-70 family)
MAPERTTEADDSWRTRETLIRRVRRQHDERAWEEFVYYYRGYVYRIARRMGLGHHDGEEIVQVVMLKLWKKLPDFEYDERKGRFRGWLCTVTGNEVRMLLRRKARDLERLSPAQQQEVRDYLHRVTVPAPDAWAEQEWVSYVTALAWSRIQGDTGAKERAAFELLSRGATPEEVGVRLGLATSSVYVYKKRVQDRLRVELARLNRDLD